jgi:hypothetical protein
VVNTDYKPWAYNPINTVVYGPSFAQEINDPKAVREEVFRERLDEGVIIVPDEMETGSSVTTSCGLCSLTVLKS